MDDDIANRAGRPEYLKLWSTIQRALYENTWPILRSLRLSNFKIPDQLLIPFILKHTSSLRYLALIRCNLGYEVPFQTPRELGPWGDEYEPDNLRKMLDTFKCNMTLEKFQVIYNIDEPYPYDQNWDLLRLDDETKVEWKGTSGKTSGLAPSDAELIESYLKNK